MTKNIVCGAAGLVLAAAYYVLADALPRSLLDDPTGASGLPKLLAVLLGGFSLALIAVTVARRTAPAGEARPVRAHVQAAGLLGVGVLYLLVLPGLGYLGAIFMLVLTVSLYAGARGVTPLVVSVVGALGLWAMFVRLFGIAMPTSTWFG